MDLPNELGTLVPAPFRSPSEKHGIKLSGIIACPTAAVGSPGKPEVLRGCVLLKSTPYHDLRRTQAA